MSKISEIPLIKSHQHDWLHMNKTKTAKTVLKLVRERPGDLSIAQRKLQALQVIKAG